MAVQTRSHGGDEAVPALTGGISGVHQEEAAGAIGIFGLSRGEAGLTEEGGLLVTGDTRDRHLDPLELSIAVDLAGVPHLGKEGAGDVQKHQEDIVPAEPVDVVEHGAGGIGVV